VRRASSEREEGHDDLLRLRETLALREEQIKFERARVRQLELELQLREKEMEIERLKVEVASVGRGNGTTLEFSPRTVDDDDAQPTLETASDSGSARKLETLRPLKKTRINPESVERCTGEGTLPTSKTSRSNCGLRWSGREVEALLDFVSARRCGLTSSGFVPNAAFKPNDVLINTLSRFTAGKQRTIAAVISKLNGHSSCSAELRRRYADASVAKTEKNGSAPQSNKDQNRTKRSRKHTPIDTVVENGSITNHAYIKLRKTSHAVSGPNGQVVFTPIEGVKFCHRCKRTNREEAAFAENNNSICIRCNDRIKELAEARKGSGSPAKKLKLHLPPVAPDGKRDLLRCERIDKWRKILKAIVAGDVDLLNKLKQQFEADKALYRNMIEWDQEIFQVAADSSKHPLRVINWALLNHAKRDEINEGAIKCAVARKKTNETIPVDGSPYTPAVKVLKHLIKCKFPVTCDVLHTACAYGDVECVQYLKEHVPICDFTEWGDKFMRPDGEPNELMLIAAQEGHQQVLQYLYDNDCDFSIEDAHTCLHLAKARKPKRADGYDQVKAYIESLPEFHSPSLELEVEE